MRKGPSVSLKQVAEKGERHYKVEYDDVNVKTKSILEFCLFFRQFLVAEIGFLGLNSGHQVCEVSTLTSG